MVCKYYLFRRFWSLFINRFIFLHGLFICLYICWFEVEGAKRMLLFVLLFLKVGDFLLLDFVGSVLVESFVSFQIPPRFVFDKICLIYFFHCFELLFINFHFLISNLVHFFRKILSLEIHRYKLLLRALRNLTRILHISYRPLFKLRKLIDTAHGCLQITIAVGGNAAFFKEIVNL